MTIQEAVHEIRVKQCVYDPARNLLTIGVQSTGNTRLEVARYLIESEINRLAKRFYKNALARARLVTVPGVDRQLGRLTESKPITSDPSLLKRLLNQAKKEARSDARAWQPESDWGIRGLIQMTPGPALRALLKLSSGEPSTRR